MKGEEKIISISKTLKASLYFNLPGGVGLYDHTSFSKEGIMLEFIKPSIIEYKQFNENFVPNLSIFDVMMFNDECTIREMLNN